MMANQPTAQPNQPRACTHARYTGGLDQPDECISSLSRFRARTQADTSEGRSETNCLSTHASTVERRFYKLSFFFFFEISFCSLQAALTHIM